MNAASHDHEGPASVRNSQGFRRVEREVLDHIREKGYARVVELHQDHGGMFRNPARVLERLCRLGLVVRQKRGVYVLPLSHRERVAALRAHAVQIRRGVGTAQNGLRLDAFGEKGRILKGQHVTYSDRMALPGDIVMVTRGSARTLRRLVALNSRYGEAEVTKIVLGHDEGMEELDPSDSIQLRPVNGIYRRCTRSAAAARSEADLGAGMEGPTWKPPGAPSVPGAKGDL